MFHRANLQMYILDFMQAPADFARTAVGLHCSGIQGKLLIFWIHNTSFFHGTLNVNAGIRTAWP
jgi:hypothetical protein